MLIDQADLLWEMDKLFVREFMGITTTVNFEKGDVVFREGDPADYFYTLVEGKVRDAEKMDQYFAIISRDTDKLARLVNNLLDFTKIEEGRKEYVFADTDLARLAADEVERFNKERAIAEPPIRLDISGEIPILRADADALSRALANLLSNAVKFTPPAKSIRVCLATEGTSVVLDVEDEGIGIPPDETAKVFEKFYQGRNALEQSANGTGLGLTLVKHIVEAHGGRILVESRL